MIVTVPAFIPVTTPFEATVAIVSSEDDHVTELEGSPATPAERVVVLPTSTVLDPLIVTDVISDGSIEV